MKQKQYHSQLTRIVYRFLIFFSFKLSIVQLYYDGEDCSRLIYIHQQGDALAFLKINDNEFIVITLQRIFRGRHSIGIRFRARCNISSQLITKLCEFYSVYAKRLIETINANWKVQFLQFEYVQQSYRKQTNSEVFQV